MPVCVIKELEHLLVLSQYEQLSLFPEKPLKFCFFYGWKSVKIPWCPMNEEVGQLLL
jgi:hypothetical protein